MQQLFPREGEKCHDYGSQDFRKGEWAEKCLGDIVEVASGQIGPN